MTISVLKISDGVAFRDTKAKQQSAWLLGEIVSSVRKVLAEQAGGPGFEAQSPHKEVRVRTLAILALGSQDSSTGKGAFAANPEISLWDHMVEGELTVES